MSVKTGAIFISLALSLLPLAGCQAEKPPLYQVAREASFKDYPYADLPETMERGAYEARGNPKTLPIQSNEAQWVAEDVCRLAYHDGDEWRSQSERFDTLIQALYIWNSPVNQYAGAAEQLARLEPILEPSLYHSLVSSGHYQRTQEAFAAYQYRAEVIAATLQPYVLAFTDGQGRRILRYCTIVVQDNAKMGDYDFPARYIDQFPYYVGNGDIWFCLYVYVQEDTQRIIQFEEVYQLFYFSNAFTVNGLVKHDVYPGYSYYLDHMAGVVHTLPQGQNTLDAIHNNLMQLLIMLCEQDAGVPLSRQALEEFCTPSLLSRLDEEGYIEDHRAFLAQPGLQMHCREPAPLSSLPLRSYVTREGHTVMLMDVYWQGDITLPKGIVSPARDRYLVDGDTTAYRTTFYVVEQDGSYRVDEWTTFDYLKS